jgi:hypothetical protein
MDTKNVSRAKERLSALEAEWEALHGMKVRIDAFPDLVGAAPGRIEEARDYLMEKGRGSLERPRREARKGLELLEQIGDLNTALAAAALAIREKAYDRAIDLLKPFAGVSPRFIGDRGSTELEKVEALVRRERDSFTEAMRAAETAGRGKQFQKALDILAPFESGGIEEFATKASEKRRVWTQKAEAFREAFGKAEDLVRSHIAQKDYAAAKAALEPFLPSDLEDVSGRAKEILTEVTLRTETPEGTVFVPRGAVQTPTGEESAVGPFYLMRTEVTCREFAAYLKEHPGSAHPTGWADGRPPEGAGNLPVTGVTQAETMAYAAWLSTKKGSRYRLPSEIEWQWAASGGRGPFPWGKATAPLKEANIATGKILSVESRTQDRSPFGALHMGGNVSEWTTAAGGKGSVVKGGSYADPDRRGAAVGFRVPWDLPGGRLPHLGFRLLVEAEKY